MGLNISLTVNGDPVSVHVESDWSLLRTLREGLRLTGTKEGCGAGECGACTVLVDGVAVNACIYPALDADGCEVVTVEGLTMVDGALHPLQKAFIEKGAVQCGFCTPGMLMSAKALLDRVADPTEHEIRTALAGNICRCTGYVQIIAAVNAAAADLRESAESMGGPASHESVGFSGSGA
ncbi:MAG: (2Fe-2S)-binding protein [Thermoleophilia bacterium]